MFDIMLNRRLAKRCDRPTRRDFLRVGGLSAFGLSLPHLLAAQAAAAPARAAKARAKSVILVYLGGGLSHHDSFDLKPAAPEEIRGKYRPIRSNVPGLQVGELLPRMAQTMDKVTLIRSGAHNNDHHETATNWVLSGRFGSAFGDYPALGAVAAHEFGFHEVLPPYVAIPQNPAFTWELGKSAFLGGRYESFKTGDPGAANFRVQDVTPRDALPLARVERRESLLKAVETLADRVHGNDQIATYDEFRRRATNMILSPQAQAAFAIDQEPDALRDRYGRNTIGQSCLLARRLVERGVRFATVFSGGWDHHSKIWEGLERKLPEFDSAFATLIDDLDQRGLLAETLVVALGEFGRTPKVNKDAGRDHWAPAASLLFAGAGAARGKVIGATDAQGAQVTERPVAPADVAFTVLDALGISPHHELVTPDGRPIPILDKGERIGEIFEG